MATHVPSRSVQLARLAEVLYALTALFIVAGLPQPSPRTVLPWVHWLGSAILAALVAWRLRAPARTTLAVAAILAAYVLGNSIWALPRLLVVVRNSTGVILAVAVLVPLVICLTQLAVLIVAIRARGTLPRATSMTRNG